MNTPQLINSGFQYASSYRNQWYHTIAVNEKRPPIILQKARAPISFQRQETVCFSLVFPCIGYRSCYIIDSVCLRNAITTRFNLFAGCGMAEYPDQRLSAFCDRK